MKSGSPSVVLAAFTHFGGKGLKGTGMYHLVEEAWRRGYLRQAIVVSKKRNRYDFDPDLLVTLPGESRLISLLGRLKARIRRFPARWLSELLFDGYAASRLTEPGDILLSTPGAVRTARKARALGYQVLLYGATADPRYLVEQIRFERRALGLRGNPEALDRSRMMARVQTSVTLADRLIALSEFARDTYVSYGFPVDRTFVVPLGVALERFPACPPPRNGPLTYLFMSHVTQTTGIIKGLQYLLRAWGQLDLADARLLVCGKLGPEAQELVKSSTHTLRNVEFLGEVQDPARYYRAASVFVLPSIAEGMAKVTLEAMATGRAVIATPNSGTVARDGVDGLLVPARDVRALADAMLTLYRRRDLIDRMGANAADHARGFPWRRFSVKVADIVEDVWRGQAQLAG